MYANSFLPIVAPLKFYTVVPTADWVARMVDAGANTVQLRNKTQIGSALRCVWGAPRTGRSG